MILKVWSFLQAFYKCLFYSPCSNYRALFLKLILSFGFIDVLK
jgi:hypothetical protein